VVALQSLLAALFLLAMASMASADEPIQISVDATKPSIRVSPSLYGVFFEEINQAGEGGLYSELVQSSGMNGSRDGNLPPGWSGTSASFDTAQRSNENRPGSIHIKGSGEATNSGFWGMHIPSGKARIVAWVKTNQPMRISLRSGPNSYKLASVEAGGSWQLIDRVVRVNERPRWPQPGPTPMGRADFTTNEGEASTLVFSATGAGSSYIGYASLKSEDADGFRADLFSKVSAMRPAFVRFPGGCYVEGQDLSKSWKWKDSLGPVYDRKGQEVCFWGYTTSNGLGFHEYLTWCEKMRAAPLFVANVGMSHSEITPLDEMDQWVESALDAIEYANGSATSKWGAQRAKNGHPKPFNLKYVEIGNENGFGWSFGGPQPYYDRYKILFDAIKKKYPKIITIADVPVPSRVEVIDEHYYQSPAWFWSNAHRYDDYDRSGPKIYVGEYAVTRGSGAGNLDAALGEAAFMTGMERNSDIVTMSSYAPLFVNVNNKQWNPDAIVFDSGRSYGTPSYWVQALFGQNRPDVIVEHSVTGTDSKPPTISGGVGLQTWRTQAEFKDVRVVADGREVFNSARLANADLKLAQGKWTLSSGVIKQTSEEENRRLVFPSVNLAGTQHYIYSMKARKLAGDEGFIIMFDTHGDGRSMQWNVGGWGNKQNAFQADGDPIQPMLPGSIGTGKWYDIRIEREPGKISAYLDGKLVQTVSEPSRPDFTVVAGVSEKARELVVKVVNGSDVSRSAILNLNGVRAGARARGILLTGGSLLEENTFTEPNKISPTKFTTDKIGPSMSFSFAPRSLTILRMPLEAKGNQ
jgi:alpha-L-arabinofuranosidase